MRFDAAGLRPADATVIGSLPRSTPLRLTIALHSRDPAGLADYAKAVAEPGSASYHQFLTVSEFAQRFGAAPTAIAAVQASLRARGLRPGAPTANGLSIPVRGSAQRVSTAFRTTLARLRLRGGRIAITNTSAPALPRAVAPDVQAIIGLSTVATPRPAGLRRPRDPRPSPAPPTPPPLPHPAGPRCLQPSALPRGDTSAAGVRHDHHLPSLHDQPGGGRLRFPGLYTPGDLGSGTTVAVFELEGNFPVDTTAYRACFGTTGTVHTVKVAGGPPAPSALNDDGYETQIDIDNIVGLAPQADVLVYQGPDTAAGSYETDAAIITANRASILSQSWGLCESELGGTAIAAEATLFQEAAVQGMTVLAASGDVGSGDCDTNGAAADTAPAVNDPAAQPFVTGVGGTTLSSLTGPAESAWNDAFGAGGGGPSLAWGAPSFQTDAASALGIDSASQPNLSGCAAAAVNGYCRLVPDVSADADPVHRLHDLLQRSVDDRRRHVRVDAGVGGSGGAGPELRRLRRRPPRASSTRRCTAAPARNTRPTSTTSRPVITPGSREWTRSRRSPDMTRSRAWARRKPRRTPRCCAPDHYRSPLRRALTRSRARR